MSYIVTDGDHRQLPRRSDVVEALPPPLTSSPHLSATPITLVYHCVDTLKQTHSTFSQPIFPLDVDRGAMEFALCPLESQNASKAITRHSDELPSAIASEDMYGLFVSSSSTVDAAAECTTSLSRGPAFQRCCPRLRCRLFDIVVSFSPPQQHSFAASTSGKRLHAGTNSRLRCGVEEQLHEVLRLVFAAHTGSLPRSNFTAPAPVDDAASIREESVNHVASSINTALAALVPLSFVPSFSLSLTLTSSFSAAITREYSVGLMGLSSSHSGVDAQLVKLHWSWVDADTSPLSEHAMAQAISSCHSIRPGSDGGEQWSALLNYWTAALVPVETDHHGTPLHLSHRVANEYASPAQNSAILRRLRGYAQRCQSVFFPITTTATTSRAGEAFLCGSVTHVERQSNAQRMFCALAAILTEVKTLRMFWASPATALALQSRDILANYLLVWFNFLGGELRPEKNEVERQTDVQSALLAFFGDVSSTATSTSTALLANSLSVVMRWVMTQMLQEALDCLPTSVPAAETVNARQQLLGPSCLHETHVLFRGNLPSRRAFSTDDSHARVAPSLVRHSDAAQWEDEFALRLHAPSTLRSSGDRLVALLENLLRVVAEDGAALQGETGTEEATMCAVLRDTHPTLTSDLFTHPARHGVVVCRLYLLSSLDALLSPSVVLSATFLPFDREASVRVARGPVAALLTWYAVDFVRTFTQAYRCHALMRRYGEVSKEDDASLVDRAIIFSKEEECVRSDGAEGQQRSVLRLGLLGQCLLLGLWMRLTLADLDMAPLEGRDTTGCIDTVKSKAGHSCGSLYYSSRRNMLFVRDWRTVRHLHNVVAAAAVERSDAHVARETTKKQKSHVRTGLAATAASTVVGSFLQARAAQLLVQERQRQATAELLYRRFQAAQQQQQQRQQEEQQRRRRDVVVIRLQAWLRACLSRQHVARLCIGRRDRERPGSPAPQSLDSSFVVESDDDCVLLLHWSTVEEEKGVVDATPRGDSVVEAVSSSQQCTPLSSPTRDLTKDFGQVAAFDKCTVAEPSVSSSRTSPPHSITLVQPPFAAENLLHYGLRQLVEVEARERALLVRAQLSHVLWCVGLLECVERRACEEAEALTRKCAISSQHGDAQCTELLSGQMPKDARVASQGQELATPLHDDEKLPPEVDAAAVTTALFNSLRDEETLARRVLRGVEQRMRDYIEGESVRRQAHCALFACEAQHRRLYEQMDDLERREWQARWRLILVPECVLREVYKDELKAAVLDALSKQQQRSTLKVKIGGAKSSTASQLPSTAAEVAQLHRAFLWNDCAEAKKTSAVVVAPSPFSQRRSTSPLARSPPLPQPSVVVRPPSESSAFTKGVRRDRASDSTLQQHQKEGTPQWCSSFAAKHETPSPSARTAAPVAHSSVGSTHQTKSIPVVAVSLCDDAAVAGGRTSLQQSVQEDEKPSAEGVADQLAGLSTDLSEENDSDSAVVSTHSKGWWYVPLRVEDEQTASGAARTAPPPLLRQPRKSRALSLLVNSNEVAPGNAKCKRMVLSRRTVTRSQQRPSRKAENVASAVAAAVAVARASGLAAERKVSGTQKKCNVERTHATPREMDTHGKHVDVAGSTDVGGKRFLGERDHNALPFTKLRDTSTQPFFSGGAEMRKGKEEEAVLPAARPPRKRYVTWADDVEDH